MSLKFLFILLFIGLLPFYGFSQSPGNVSGGLTIWLKADAEADNTGALATEGQEVDSWTDQSPNGTELTLPVGIGGGEGGPTFRASSINGNPALEFNDDFLAVENYPNMPANAFTLFTVQFTTGTNFGGVFAYSVGTTDEIMVANYSDLEIDIHGDQNNLGGIDLANGIAQILAVDFDEVSNGLNAFQNGVLAGTSTYNEGTATIQNNGLLVIGQETDNETGGGFAGAEFFDGTISEIILYDSELSPADRRDIETYLAIRYGVTLDMTTLGYTLSNGATVLYDNTDANYITDIAGIGTDLVTQGLNQTTSQSANTGSILQVSGATDQGNGEYMVWASNGGSTTTITENYNGVTANGLSRSWRMVQTGDLGTVTISATLPAGITHLIVDNNADLNSPEQIIEVTGSGPSTVAVDFDNNATSYFSFIGFPEIAVSGNSVDITDGDGVPDAADHTDFGNADLVAGFTRTFTITNSALVPLNITSVGFNGGNAGDFAVSSAASTPVAANGGSTTFDVTFTPGALGFRTTTLEIVTDDQDETTFDFAISGNGVSVPEISVEGNTSMVEIVNGDLTPNAADDTDFGISAVPVAQTFTIRNLGSADLNLGATSVSLSNTTDFSISSAQPGATVTSLATETFEITFNAVNFGIQTTTVTINNDDSDESPYTFTLQAQNPTFPGDVNTGISLWLKGDAGVSLDAGVTAWADQISGNDAIQNTDADQPAHILNAINGNPVLDFDGGTDQLDGTAGFYTNQYFLVLQPDVAIDGSANGFPVGFQNAGFGGLWIGDQTDGVVGGDVVVHGINEGGGTYRSAYTGAQLSVADEPVIFSVNDNTLVTPTQHDILFNGVSITPGLNNTFANLTDQPYRIGDNLQGDNNFDGGIAEVISFTGRLTDAERRDVETYLAIKYGITLGALNYTSSNDVGTIYDNTGYPNDIAGIGSNDSQGLSQTSSTSFSGGIVTMNNASDLDNEEYLIWGRDGGATTLTVSDVPGGVTNRLDRIWRVDETGDVGTIDISFNLNALGLSGSLTYDLIIATSGASMPTGLSGGTTVTGSVNSGVVTFSNVTLNDDEFFTLGITDNGAEAPGNVATDLSIWLKADEGVVESGGIVSSWIDQSNGGNSAFQGNATERPSLETAALNNNPVLDFDGDDDDLIGSGGFYTQDYFIVTRPNQIVDSDFGDQSIFGLNDEDNSGVKWGATGGVADAVLTHSINADAYNSSVAGAALLFSDPLLINFRNDASTPTAQEVYLDGLNTAVGENGTFANLSNVAYNLGSNGVGADHYDGFIAEVVSYSSLLSDADRRDVASYLAIKYGLTLDINQADGDASNDAYTVEGVSVFNHASYDSNIAGIGQDDSQGLLQTSSKSSNSGSLVSISNPGSLDDGDFLIWGSDGGALTITTSDVPGGSVTERVTRVWRVDLTGTVGTVDLVFDISELALNLDVSSFNLLTAPNTATIPGDLVSATVSTAGTVVTSNGRTTVTFNGVLLNDDEYFTLGGNIVSEFPGDANNGLSLWLKADEGVELSSGGTNVVTWIDVSGSGNSGSTDDSADEPLFVADGINGNPTLNFDGAQSDVSNTSGFNTHDIYVVLDPDEIYTGVSGDDAVLSFNIENNDDNTGIFFGNHIGGPIDDLSFSIDNPTYDAGLVSGGSFADPIIVNFRNNSVPDAQELYLNGTLSALASVTGTFSIQTDASYRIGQNGVEGDSFDGNISEVMSYSVRQDDATRRDIETYLAIKYGITIPLPYTADGGSIYDNAGYANDIAGIALNESQGLNQTTSRSENAGSIVSIGNASDLEDGEYLIWGNDAGGTVINSVDVPGGGIVDRLTQVWQVDENTGGDADVGTVDIVFDITSIAINESNSTFFLLVDGTDATFNAGATSTAGSLSVVDGRTLITFTGINLDNDDFFTLGGTFVPEAPGNAGADLSVWLKADDGPVESGGTIETWIDRSGNGNDAIQPNVEFQPTLLSDNLNGNPAVNFDGAVSNLFGADGFYTDDYFVVLDLNEVLLSTSGDDYAIGFNEDFSGLVYGSFVPGFDDEVLSHLVNGAYISAVQSTTENFSRPIIINFRHNNTTPGTTTSQDLFIDGGQLNGGTVPPLAEAGTFANFADVSYRLGSRTEFFDHWTGAMSEFISYSDRLTDAERRDVATYLAIKYGLTLDITTANYTVSTVAGNIIYDNTGYPNNIAGLANDQSQGLLLTSASSQNDGSAITISNPSGLDDNEFFVWGNDGLAIDVITDDLPAGPVNRIRRIWRAEETGDIGTIDVVFDLTSLGLAGDGTYNLLIAGSGETMPTGLTNASVSAAGVVSTVNGRTIVTFAGVDIEDDEFFTLAGDLTKPAPGDVVATLELWLKGGAGVVQSGSLVTNWLDQSGNGNDADQILPVLQPVFNSDALNSNPGITFDGTDDTMLGNAGFHTQDYFVVMNPSEVYNNVNATGRIIGFEPNDIGSLSFGPSTGLIADEVITHTFDNGGGNYLSAQVSTASSFGNPTIVNSHNVGASQQIRRDGVRVDTNESGTFANFTDTPYQIGEAFNNGGDDAPFNGTITELISFNTALTDFERRDVATYLALKYGITLDISGADPFDAYTFGGAGAEIFNFATYVNDIAGIGQDDSQGLNQTTSKSVNGGSIVQLATPSDLNDEEFLIWGNNAGDLTFVTNDVPAGALERLTRVWRLDETGDVGTVDISFDLTTLGIDVTNSTLNLIIAPTSATIPTDFASASLISSGVLSTVNGRDILTFSAVDFADGDYFTLAGDVQTTAPGGVANNLELWLRGDNGITSSGGLVSNWSDRSGNGNDAFQGTSSEQPTLVAAGINTHDVLDFDNDNLDGLSGFHSQDYFIVFRPDVTINNTVGFGYPLAFTNRDDNGLVLGAEANLLTDEVISHITSDASANAYQSGLSSTTQDYDSGIPVIVNSKNNDLGTQQELFIDGATIAVSQVNVGNFTNYTDEVYRLGNNLAENGAFDGQIAEVISYSSRLTDTERRDVETYLALRYGITLDISSQFYTEGGVTIFDNTAYANDIAGIGRNLDNGIDQSSSISSNAGSIVTISNPGDLDDNEYLIWGNDGTDKTLTQTTELEASFEQRLSAEWQVDVTGNPGSVTISFDLSAINGIGALPTSPATYTLLVDDDNDFSADLVSTIAGSSLTSNILTFSGVSLSNDSYFTLALPTPPAPGDVSTSLSLWLRADAGVTESSSVVSDWSDQSGNNNDASQGITGSRPDLLTNNINGNPVVDFDGTDDVLEGISGSGFDTREYFVVFDPDNAISNVSSAEAVLGYNSGNDNGLYLGNANALTDEVISHTVNTYSRGQTSTTITYSDPLLINSRNNDITVPTDQELFANGTQIDNDGTGAFANLADTDFTLGDRFTTGLPLDGKIAEVISYNRTLGDAEKRDVETYLAVKYGLSLDISGADPFDAYTAETVEIYNQTAYANDIAALGVNGSQELNQTASTSINSSAIVTVSNAGGLSDGEYLVWGHDGDVLTAHAGVNIPAGVTERVERVWGVTETGNVGNVTVAFDLSSTTFTGNALNDFQLIVDNDADFTNGVNQLVFAVSFNANILTFTGVDFTGATNFSLGTQSDFLLDSDSDGIPDYYEVASGTDPNDGNNPLFEGGNDDNVGAPVFQGINDTGINGDGITDALEQILITNGATAPISRITDSDGDGIPDYLEVRTGSDPFNSNQPTINGANDTDGDGLPDALEALIISSGGPADPFLGDDDDVSDGVGDGIADYYEVLNGNDPSDVNDPTVAGGTDSDADGVSDGLEQILIDGGTVAPVSSTTDTDQDGIPDFIEAQTYTDPYNPNSPFPVGLPNVRSLLADFTVSGANCVDLSGFQWVDVTDNLGNLVFSINPVGNNLGTTCWGVRVLNSNDDDVRDNGTDYVLDRNWFITPTNQPVGSDVYVRFYTLADEHTDLGDELLAAEAFVFDEESHLRITRISGITADLDPFVTGGTRVNLDPSVADYLTNGRSLTLGFNSFSLAIPHVTPSAINAPLPIELISFQAESLEDRILLTWATASEFNNDFFTIERSLDASNFDELGIVDGAGDSDQRIDYSFEDLDPVPGVNYYRLKQTDYDGSESYSEVVVIVYEEDSQLVISVYPNPAENYINVEIPASFNSGAVGIRIMDLAGKPLLAFDYPNGSNTQIPLSSLDEGVYILEVEVGNRVYSQRIIKN